MRSLAAEHRRERRARLASARRSSERLAEAEKTEQGQNDDHDQDDPQDCHGFGPPFGPSVVPRRAKG